MTVAAKRGVPYEPGAFLVSMPATFLGSMEFLDWNADYYDIVTLGAVHWLYNDRGGRQGSNHQTAERH
jgi:hypothetical protein